MPLVKAKLVGFRNGVRVRPGTVFEWPEGKKLAKWVELHKPAAAPKAAAPEAQAQGQVEDAAGAEAPVAAKDAPEKEGVLSKLGWGNKTREARIEEDLAG